MSERLLVLGDSHTLVIVPALKQMRPDLQILGGQLRLLPHKAKDLSRIDEQGRMRVHPDMEDQLARYLEPLGLGSEDLFEVDCPIVLSLSGVFYHAMQPEWSIWLPFPSADRHFMSQALFDIELRALFEPILSFVGHLAGAGKQVAAVISPGLRSNYERRGELFQWIRAFYSAELTRLGVSIVDVTDATCDAQAVLQRQYWHADPKDFVHANAGWGRLVAEACLKELRL